MNTWLRYARRFRPHWVLMAGAVAAGVAQSLACIPLAMLLRRVFDVILPARDLTGLWIAVGELLALQAITLLLMWWIRTTTLQVSQDVLTTLRRDCIRLLYELPREFHTTADMEHLHVTMVYETQLMDAMNNSLTASILPSSLSAAALFFVLFRTEPGFALIVAVSAPALFVVNRAITRKVWFRQELLRQAFENFSRAVRFCLNAMDLTKSQAAEKGELARQTETIENLRRVALDLTRLDTGQQIIQSALLLASTLTVLLAGGWAVAEGRLTGGQMMAFYVITALFASQARTIVEAIPPVRMGMRAFRQVSELLGIPAREPYQGSECVGEIRELRMQNASFSYPDGPVLIDDCSLTIRRGDTVAILGANGSGKSSLMFLFAGFYRPQRGNLFVNGLPYEQTGMRSLRSRMAIVPQHPFLFAGTVRENLTYGAEDATEEAISEAIGQTGAADFIKELPEGFDTGIGELGVRLSGGQRQRLVIARALLRRPDLLILDEPTNHLDEAGIAGLMHSLGSLPYRPAVMIISHEWRVLRHTSRALYLSEGRLRESTPELPSFSGVTPMEDSPQ